MTQQLRQAAVLAPLYRGPDRQVHLTLIERSPTLPLHPGQIAFPGGTYDPARDTDLLATALREANEEIGLDPRAVTILGVLPERQTYTSQFRIMPFVGRIEAQPRLIADPAEVAAVLTVRVDHFRIRPRETLQREYRGRAYEVPCVRVDDRLVWGATLDIIDNLLDSPLLALA